MIVGGIRKGSEVVIDLNDAHREMLAYRYVDPTADAGGKTIGAIGHTRFTASGMSAADEDLSEWLGFMISVQPRLVNFVSRAG